MKNLLLQLIQRPCMRAKHLLFPGKKQQYSIWDLGRRETLKRQTLERKYSKSVPISFWLLITKWVFTKICCHTENAFSRICLVRAVLKLEIKLCILICLLAIYIPFGLLETYICTQVPVQSKSQVYAYLLNTQKSLSKLNLKCPSA